jgi:hypothetical protein
MSEVTPAVSLSNVRNKGTALANEIKHRCRRNGSCSGSSPPSSLFSRRFHTWVTR